MATSRLWEQELETVGQDEQHGHAIRVVTRRTGLSAHVIRVWERRYGAVEPVRTPTNRRLYTDADIERLRLLHMATKAGHSIGRIATLPDERLAELIRQDSPKRLEAGEKQAAEPGDYVVAAMAAIERLDAAGLEAQLARAATDMSRNALMETVIDPLMDQIGTSWERGTLRIADEHMASAIVRAFLGSIHDLRRMATSGPGIVVTTPSGQVHEIGAMMVAIVAAAAGWRAVYLGPDLPADEISGAARRHGARVVALSIVFPFADPQLSRELSRLRAGLDDDVAIFVGGRASDSYAEPLREIGAHIVSGIGDLREQLTKYGT